MISKKHVHLNLHFSLIHFVASKRYDNEPEAFRKEVLKTVSASKEKIDEAVKSDDPHILR